MRYLPPFSIWLSEDRENSKRELIAGKHFRLEFSNIECLFRPNPSPQLLDLLRIATSIYVVDRLARRKRHSREGRWFRSLRVAIMVREPGFWQSPEILDTLRECTEFLSEDAWDLTFVKDDQQPPDRQPFLPFPANPPIVCLYSGGLDSAAGLAIRMAEEPDRPVLPVTIRHQTGQEQLISDQWRIMKERYGNEIHHAILRVGLKGAPLEEQERTQRCRSLLFGVAGGLAAAMSGTPTVEVFESGIGAMNLPLLADMVGARATRGSHPHLYYLMSRLLTLA